MFTAEDLAIIHKAISELTIKGADSPKIAVLLAKITEHHTKLNNPPGNTKKGK